ncbi:MAG TPA: hypothetical protein VJT81_00455 [Burkholderiales bacterium]|nr:hypothetical protein [Burkholderiales bacterium]
MSALPKLAVVSNDDIQIDYGTEVLIPDATYEVVYQGHKTALVFGKHPSVSLRFRIITPGEYFGKEIARHYRVAKLKGEPRENGAFTLRRNSLLFLELVRLSDFKQKPSRISLSVLRGCAFEVSTRTVKKSWHKQTKLPIWLQYSVVDRIRKQTAGAQEI